MRRIAIINQKGGVGKTTTTVNLGAALAIQGRHVVIVDMDAQANLSLALGVEARSGTPTTYSVLTGDESIDACLLATKVPGLRLLPSNIDLSGAELELASAMGREYLLRDALKEWDDAHKKSHSKPAADYVLFDCPPSLGLLSINALAAAGEVLITLQTEFLALQGMSKLVEIVALLKKRLNPDLVVVGIVPTLYDIRLKLAREVLGEIRRYFKDQVMPHPIRANVKLAEAPSFAQTIFEYAPDSNGAVDYMHLARELIERESRDADLVGLPAFDAAARLPSAEPLTAPRTRRMPPPRKKKAVETVSASAIQSEVPKATAATANAAAEIAPKAPPPASPTASKPSTKHVIPAKGTGATRAALPVKNRTPKRALAPTNDVPTQTATSSGPDSKPHAGDEAHTQRASTNGAPAKSPPANDAHAQAAHNETAHNEAAHNEAARNEAARNEPVPTRTHAKTLKPVPRTARVDHIPPLPPDAFEILSTPIDP